MTLKDITGWGLQGNLIADNDVSDNANLSRSKLGTRTAYLDINPCYGYLSGTSVAKTTDGVFSSVLFPDANTGNMRYSFPLPNDYASGDLTLRIFWKSAATAGDAYFEIEFSSVVAGVSTTALAETTPTGTSTVNGTANRINSVALTVSASFVTSGDICFLNLARVPGNAADTLGADLEVLLIRMEYTARG